MATTMASRSWVWTAVLCRSSTVSARSSSTSAAMCVLSAAGRTTGAGLVVGVAPPNALNMGAVPMCGGDALLMAVSWLRTSSPHVDNAVQLDVVPLDAVRRPAQALLLASDACRRCWGVEVLCGTSGRSSIALRVACQLSHLCLMSTCEGDADAVLIAVMLELHCVGMLLVLATCNKGEVLCLEEQSV